MPVPEKAIRRRFNVFKAEATLQVPIIGLMYQSIFTWLVLLAVFMTGFNADSAHDAIKLQSVYNYPGSIRYSASDEHVERGYYVQLQFVARGAVYLGLLAGLRLSWHYWLAPLAFLIFPMVGLHMYWYAHYEARSLQRLEMTSLIVKMEWLDLYAALAFAGLVLGFAYVPNMKLAIPDLFPGSSQGTVLLVGWGMLGAAFIIRLVGADHYYQRLDIHLWRVLVFTSCGAAGLAAAWSVLEQQFNVDSI